MENNLIHIIEKLEMDFQELKQAVYNKHDIVKSEFEPKYEEKQHTEEDTYYIELYDVFGKNILVKQFDNNFYTYSEAIQEINDGWYIPDINILKEIFNKYYTLYPNRQSCQLNKDCNPLLLSKDYYWSSSFVPTGDKVFALSFNVGVDISIAKNNTFKLLLIKNIQE